MTQFTRNTLILGASLFTLGLGLAPATAGDPLQGLPANPSQSDVLKHLLKLSPADRMLMIEKIPVKQRGFASPTRGPLIQTIAERGSLHAVQSSGVYCTIKTAVKGSTAATTIRWLVDDGALVKKGDKLIEFDVSALVDRIRQQKAMLAQAETELRKAANQLAGAEREAQLDIKLADVDVRLAALAVRQYKGPDATQKEILEIKVVRAGLLLQRIKATAAAKEVGAAADRDGKKAIHEQESSRLRDLQIEHAKYILHAPQNGLVVYEVPESTRLGVNRDVVAVGEPVREGQKLLSLSDLKQFYVNARIHEALIARVRKGQKASVHVDAFPGQVFTGKVQDIATVADQAEFFSRDVKVYSVKVLIDGEGMNLKPGMSAEARIITGEAANCLRLPVSAALLQNKEWFCFVLENQKLDVRKLKVGLRNERFVEVMGLDAGDMVLINPRVIADRLADSLRERKQPAPMKKKPNHIRIRSVKPPDDAGVRTLVNTYGLDAKDFERIAELPSVSIVVPVRSFSHEVRRLDRHFEGGQIVATTSEYAAACSLTLTAGRFLTATDDDNGQDVAVLGAQIANDLFGSEDPIGRSVVLNKHPYVVVGVLSKTRSDDVAGDRFDDSICIPFRTCKQRFGETIFVRQGGSRRAERVQLTEILVTIRSVADVSTAVRSISESLRATHQRKDWSIEAGNIERKPPTR